MGDKHGGDSKTVRYLIALLICSSVYAASPAHCKTIPGNIAVYNDPANWSSDGVTPLSCTASGGAAKTIWGNTVTLTAGVPGAAGAGDTIDITSGTILNIPNTTFPEYSSSTTSLSDAIHIIGNSPSNRGVLIINAGASIMVHGASGSGLNFITIDQYGVLCVQPNGYLIQGAYTNGPGINVSGGLYVGQGDQTLYPVPAACQVGNAGGWVTASVATTLNFTGTLPVGLAVGRLVELDAVNQPNGAWPYTSIFDGVTPPTVPPVMPLTNDSGTCVALASCYVPQSTLLCVVAISGNAVSLGYPLGGNPWKPYCTGSEVAIAITNAGSGQLWLKEPAFFSGIDPDLVTWNNSKTYAPSAVLSFMDGVRSSLSIPLSPISNAAGTGPGRPGDTNLSASAFTLPSGLTLSNCTKLRVNDVATGTDCFVDPSYGVIVAHGYGLTWTSNGNITYKNGTAGGSTGCSLGGTVIPSGTRTYNEMIFANAEIWNVQGFYNYACIQFSGLPNTANNRAGVLHSTMRNSFNEIGIYGGTQDINHPLEFNYNVTLNVNVTGVNGGPHFVFWGPVSNVDISNGRHMGVQPLVGGATSLSSTLVTFDTVRVTNNFATSDVFWGGNGAQADNWSNTWIQQNHIQGYGIGDGGSGNNFPGYVFAFGGLPGNHGPTGATNKNIVRGNYLFGNFRDFLAYTNVRITQNAGAWAQHHIGVLATSYSVEYHTGGVNDNVEVDHNLFVSPAPSNQSLFAWQTGYDGYNYATNFWFHHNTALGMTTGFMWGDTDTNGTLMAAGSATDNILIPASSAPGLTKTEPSGFTQASILLASGNAAQGSGTFYQGVGGGNPNAVPNPNYYRNGTATIAGANYNAVATSRNITGITIQNPNFQAQKILTLHFAHASSSDMTLAESSNAGSSYGTAVQLNWSGTTYTVASVVDDGAVFDYLKVNFTGTPFAVSTPPVSALCPLSRYAVMLTGANAGTVYAIPNCMSSSQLVFSPRITGIAGGDSVLILKSEITLLDAAGANGIDVALLGTLQSLPTTAQTDNGIVIAPSDACAHAGDCGLLGIISGLPTTFTPGVWNGTAGSNSPIWPVALPEMGGSFESAACAGQTICGATKYFVPAGSAWPFVGQNGGYIGFTNIYPALPVPSGMVP